MKKKGNQNGETESAECSKSKRWCGQKHHCLQPGGWSCAGREESSLAGRRPPRQSNQDATPAQGLRSTPDPCNVVTGTRPVQPPEGHVLPRDVMTLNFLKYAISLTQISFCK